MEKYFTKYEERVDFTPQEKKMLNIREELNGLLYENNFAAVQAMIKGVLFSDVELCVAMIVWKNRWGQDEDTLLHAILEKPKNDPPISLVQMVLDIAPAVLRISTVKDKLPLHYAIRVSQPTGDEDDGIHRPAQIVKLVWETMQSSTENGAARLNKEHVHAALNSAVLRGELEVMRYLLSFPEFRKGLIVQYRGPVYYASKQSEGKIIDPVLRLVIESTANELGEGYCCLYAAIQLCDKHLEVHQPQALVESSSTERELCCPDCQSKKGTISS